MRNFSNNVRGLIAAVSAPRGCAPGRIDAASFDENPKQAAPNPVPCWLRRSRPARNEFIVTAGAYHRRDERATRGDKYLPKMAFQPHQRNGVRCNKRPAAGRLSSLCERKMRRVLGRRTGEGCPVGLERIIIGRPWRLPQWFVQ